MRDVFVVDAVRSLIGRRRGLFADVHPADLLGGVMVELFERTGVAPGEVDQVLAGCVTKIGEQAYNIARTAWLTAGLPETVAGSTVDAHCGSSLQAVALGASLIGAGAADTVVVGGVESMSRQPLGSDTHAGEGRPISANYLSRYEFVNQLDAAENLATAWAINRDAVDAYGLESQARAARAWASGSFDHELVFPAGLPKVNRDEGIRETSAPALAALAPVVRNGIHTAGTASQLSDGAAAVLLMSQPALERSGRTPSGRLVAHTIAGVNPEAMLTGPIDATKRALDLAGLTLDAIGRFEVNEAFASVVLAWCKALGVDGSRVNVNGGAIALGHPVGCSGARIIATLVNALEQSAERYGLATMCGAAGIAPAVVIEAGASA